MSAERSPSDPTVGPERLVSGPERPVFGPERPLRIHLIRHGESTWNRERRIQGQLDAPLSELGHRQAAEAAARLASRPIDAVVSSDLLRARDTAAPIAAAHGLEVMTTPALREQHFGRYEGRLYAELTDDPRAWLIRQWSEVDVAEHGGESYRELYDRVAAAIDGIIVDVRVLARGREAECEVVVVTHGGVVRAAAAHLAGIPVERIPHDPIGNASIHTFRVGP